MKKSVFSQVVFLVLWIGFGYQERVLGDETLQSNVSIMDQFVSAINSSSNNNHYDFIRKYSDNELLELADAKTLSNIISDLHDEMAPIKIMRTVNRGIGKRAAIAQNEDGSFWGLTITLSKGSSEKMSGFSSTDFSPMDKSKTAMTTLPKFLKFTKSTLENLAADDQFSGSVLLARGDTILLQEYYGLADRESGKRIDALTRFNVASITKMFTAVAIAQLVEGGKISLLDPVGRLLPNIKNRELRDKVLIQHLLSHTSGLGDFMNETYWTSPASDYRSFADLLPLFEMSPLATTPGENYIYSNAGYVLLGEIVELVSGRPLFSYFKENIWLKAGMTNTKAINPLDMSLNDAIGYSKNSYIIEDDSLAAEPRLDGNWNNNKAYLRYPTAAGGIFSTSEDLYRFMKALNAGELISNSMLSEMLQPATNVTASNFIDEKGYGYGFRTGRIDNKVYWGHHGNLVGVSSSSTYLPELDLYITITSNQEAIARIIFSNAIHLAPVK